MPQIPVIPSLLIAEQLSELRLDSSSPRIEFTSTTLTNGSPLKNILSLVPSLLFCRKYPENYRIPESFYHKILDTFKRKEEFTEQHS